MTSILLEYLLMLSVFSLAQCTQQNQTKVHSNNFNESRGNLRWCKSIVGDDLITLHRKYTDEFQSGYFNPIATNEKSIDQRLSNLLYFSLDTRLINFDFQKFNSDDPAVIRSYERYVSASNVNEELCHHHLNRMVRILNELRFILKHQNEKKISKKDPVERSKLTINERHIRLSRVLDSFGRYSSGFLDGRSKVFGSPIECTETRLQLDIESPKKLVKMRSCMARLDINTHLHPILKDNKIESFGDSRPSIEIGICLPITCHSTSFQRNKQLIQKLVDSQFSLPRSIYVDEHREVVDLFCVNDSSESGGIPVSGKLMLVLIFGWLAIILYVTILLKEDRKHLHFFKYLDIRRMLDDFDNVPSRPTERVDFRSIDIYRVVGAIILIFVHCLMLNIVAASDYFKLLSISKNNSYTMLIANAIVLVDCFYFISWMIIAYLTLKQFNTKLGQSTCSNESIVNQVPQFIKDCSKLSLHRYFKLVPLYLIVFLFKKSVYLYLNIGLQSDIGFNKHTAYGACRQETWLTPLTPMAAYLDLNHQCIPQAWSLGGDIFVIPIIFPITILLTKLPKLAGCTAVIISLLSTQSLYTDIMDAYTKTHIHEFSVISMARFFSKNTHLHSWTHYRLNSMMVAILGGYILNLYDSRKIQQWPRWFKIYVTPAACLVFFSSIILVPVIPWIQANNSIDHEILSEFFLSFFVFSRWLWALCNLVLMLRLVTDWSSESIFKIVGHKFWGRLSKLNLSLQLVHIDIILWIFYQRTEYEPFSFLNTLSTFVTALFYSLMIGFLLHLFFEAPITKMFRDLLSQRVRKRHCLETEIQAGTMENQKQHID